ncbi:MAG: mRNA interferase RelE/StbE [Bradyrhizobium sp.]|nr:mRNA interferase RelE/StbE [Bradyrhizobium sp.]
MRLTSVCRVRSFPNLSNSTSPCSVLSYLRTRIAGSGDPRRLGQPLTGDRQGLWRYRVGDYRIVAAIEDDRLVVLVVTVGHRREVYR